MRRRISLSPGLVALAAALLVPSAVAQRQAYRANGSLQACRLLLGAALHDALGVTKEQLYTDSGCTAGDQPCFDAVRHRAIGGVTVPSIPWINRPTFQQAVEVQGHRPR